MPKGIQTLVKFPQHGEEYYPAERMEQLKQETDLARPPPSPEHGITSHGQRVKAYLMKYKAFWRNQVTLRKSTGTVPGT